MPYKSIFSLKPVSYLLPFSKYSDIKNYSIGRTRGQIGGDRSRNTRRIPRRKQQEEYESGLKPAHDHREGDQASAKENLFASGQLLQDWRIDQKHIPDEKRVRCRYCPPAYTRHTRPSKHRASEKPLFTTGNRLGALEHETKSAHDQHEEFYSVLSWSEAWPDHIPRANHMQIH